MRTSKGEIVTVKTETLQSKSTRQLEDDLKFMESQGAYSLDSATGGTRKMKPEIKKELVDALRSGKYEQGRAELRSRDNKFCCLGVLCDIAVKKGAAKWHKQGEIFYCISGEYTARENINEEGWNGEKTNGVLPTGVIEWSEIPNSSGSFTADEGYKDTLIGLNDRGVPFSEIADIIERKF